MYHSHVVNVGRKQASSQTKCVADIYCILYAYLPSKRWCVNNDIEDIAYSDIEDIAYNDTEDIAYDDIKDIAYT